MKKLNEIIRELNGELITTKNPVKTVQQAAKELKTDPSNIIKSLVLVGKEPILTIIPGNKKLSLKKLEKIFGKVRFATKEEVKEITGYSIGGVPPVGIDIKTIIDKEVLNKKIVFGGGGAINKLCKLNPIKIKDYQKAIIEKITE